MAEQKLDRSQIASFSVNERRLGAAERMRAELKRIETGHGNPIREQARILARRKVANWIAAPPEQIAVSFSRSHPQITIDSGSGVVRNFELYGSSGFLLSDRGTVQRVTVWRHILDSQSNDIATSELAVDCKVE